MSKPVDNDTLGSLEIAMNEALIDLAIAETAKNDAYREHSAVLDRINKLQHRIDCRIASMKDAPGMRDTNWRRKTTYVASA